jgi:ubiquitin-activating enzyme E1 C
MVRFCRIQDVGIPKAEVAAQRVMQQVKGVTVVSHFCRTEEEDITLDQDFQIFI